MQRSRISIMSCSFGGGEMTAKGTQKKKYRTNNKKQNKKYSGQNHEIIGILILALGIMILLSFYVKGSMGLFGTTVRHFFLGLLGLPAFIIPPLIIVYAFFIIVKKDIKQLNKRAVYTLILIILASSLIQTGFFEREDYVNMNVFQYISKFYEDGKLLHGGGVLGGIVSMPFILIFHQLGTIIILTALSLVNVILLTNISIANFFRNLRRFFASKHEKASKRKKASKNTLVMGKTPNEIDSVTGDDVLYNDNALSSRIRQRAKIIDFRIEKESRESKAITDEAEKLDLIQNTESAEPIDLIVEDLKKSSVSNEEIEKKKPKNAQQTASNIENAINVQGSTYGYEFPSIDLLNVGQKREKDVKGIKNKAVEDALKLEDTLKSFGVTA